MGFPEWDAWGGLQGQSRGGTGRIRKRRALSALLLAAVLPGCSAALGDSTALQNPEGSGEICVPANSDGLATLGFHQLVNTSDGAVHIKDVSLDEPDNLAVERWALVRQGDYFMAASGGWHPPSPELEVDAVPAEAEVRLVLGLKVGQGAQELSRASGARVTYEDAGGRTGMLNTPYAITLTTGDQCP